MTADFIVRNAALVATCAGPAPRRGPGQGHIAPIPHGAIAARDGRIVFVGPESGMQHEVTRTPSATVVDAGGGTVVPGFVDPHTHAVFAGNRGDELQRRLEGAAYAEIAAAGGGILKTVEATRKATEAELVAGGRERLAEMLACGTTSCEIKSGYGLTTEAELKQLKAIRTLAHTQPIEISATFLGAHEVPPEFRGHRSAYVDLVIGEMIPRVAREDLAEWCDVFCEEGVFTPAESKTILQAGVAAGLKPRIHADELADSGGSRVAAEVGARSADHLVHVTEASAKLLAGRGVIATLLPVASLYLKLGRFAPARMLVDHGVPVAIATDMNPGGGFSPSMPFAITLACFQLGLTLDEALIGATINAACALDRGDDIGSFEVGKQMDAVILRGGLYDLVRVGAPIVAAVIKKGRVVHKG